MRTNVTAEHRVQLSQAAYYLGKCVCNAELADYSRAPTARCESALTMLAYVLGIPADYLAQLSSKAQEAAGSPLDDIHEITLWLDSYANYLATELHNALTPGD